MGLEYNKMSEEEWVWSARRVCLEIYNKMSKEI